MYMGTRQFAQRSTGQSPTEEVLREEGGSAEHSGFLGGSQVVWLLIIRVEHQLQPDGQIFLALTMLSPTHLAYLLLP